MEKNIKVKNNNLIGLQMIPIDIGQHKFQTLMSIYEKAMNQAKVELENIQATLKKIYKYNVINNIYCRIKTPESIINKMTRKHYDLNYKELISNINDIAGIRIVCPFKSDVYKIKKIIEEDSDINILEIKDYMYAPKKSGYSALHIISQTPVNIGKTMVDVKIEIQIRTMAMDFWATTEHKIKYKANNQISKIDSSKMAIYARIINKIDEKISDINSKYVN